LKDKEDAPRSLIPAEILQELQNIDRKKEKKERQKIYEIKKVTLQM
jgi:hypothetical protein